MMNKQQAIDQILARLKAGYQAEEIAEELSRLLKAPTEKTRAFVDQVASSHPEVVAPPQPATDENLSQTLGVDDNPPEVEQSYPLTSQSAPAGFSELPPGLQAIVREAESKGIVPAKTATSSKPEKPPKDSLPHQAYFVVPSDKEKNNIDLEALEEFSLGQLKKHRRHNDIVEAVCHQTGWHWNKSQRFVARVQTKHHDELQSGKNKITIVIGIGIILGGLIVAFNGIGALSDYAKIAVFAKTNPEVLLGVSPAAVLFALSATVTGLGMVVGGGYGIARSLTNR